MIQLSRRLTEADFERRLLNALTTADTFPERDRLGNDGVLTPLTADSYRVVGRDGDEYFVRALVSDGETFIHCTCDAGKNGMPCYHVGAVMLRRGLAVKFGGSFAVKGMFANTPPAKSQPISEAIIRQGRTLNLTAESGDLHVAVFPFKG